MIPTNYTIYRDSIVLDQNFQTWIKEKFTQATTLLLAARDFQIAKGFTFELSNCNLVVLADRFDGSKGKIKLTVKDSSPGQPGAPGQNLTVVCKEVAGLNVELPGGKGGTGLLGTRGKNGEEDDEPGGKGGKGKPGGNGGKGGNLKLLFVQDKVPGGISSMTGISLPGGTGGAGGAGGAGGPGGPGGTWCKPHAPNSCVKRKDAAPGPQGDLGNPGLTGTVGSFTRSQLSEKDFWATIGTFTKDWASYRLLVGEYYYRKPDLRLALDEFNAVLALNPQNRQASTYRNQILNNQNILGLARDFDVKPDFKTYEAVYKDYNNIVRSIFDAATKMLWTNVNLAQVQQNLNRQISHLDSMASALQLDSDQAKIGVQIAQKETSVADKRLEDIKQLIEQKKEELDKAEVDILGVIIGTVGLVVSTISAIYTGGASLVGAAQSIAQIGNALSSSDLSALAAEAFKPEGQRENLKKLEQEASGLKDAIPKIQQGVAAIISFKKMLDDLSKAHVDNEEYRKLIADSIELAHAQLLARLRETQAEFKLQAAQKRLQLAKDDKAAVEKQLKGLVTDNEYLKQTAFILVKAAQHYMNTLTKYAFLAARALEIYTLEDLSGQIRYDYGYIHPDREKDYQEGLITLTQLISKYEHSWTTFADLIGYADRYHTYFSSGDLVHDLHRISFKDAQVLSDFRTKSKIRFTVRIEDLPTSRLEAKVDSVYVAFVGAKPKSNFISAIVEHSGRYSEQKRNGTVLDVALQPRREVVIAKIEPLQIRGNQVGDPQELEFWGKGVAASWYLYIEPTELTNNQVDLSGLTEIQVWIGYQSFLGRGR